MGTPLLEVRALQTPFVTRPDAPALHAARGRGQHYADRFSGGRRQRPMREAARGCQPTLRGAHRPTPALDVTSQTPNPGLTMGRNRALGTAAIWITPDPGV